MNAKKLLALLLALVMVLGLAACGTQPAEPTEPSEPAETTGSELRIHLITNVMSLDSGAATDGDSFEVIADFTDGLMQLDADGNAIPAVAETYDVSEDGKTYTFHLREDAVWSNGTPVTADDFVFAWQRVVTPAFASEYNYMMSDCGQIKNAAAILAGEKDPAELGVTAVDEHTLMVELENPVPFFLGLMVFPTFYPINREFCESVGDKYGTTYDTVLCNGAYLLDSNYEPACTSFSLTKNPNYYDADKISIETLKYQVITDSQTALLAYQNNELDTVILSGEQVEQVSDDPCFMTYNAGYLWYITVNQDQYDFLANVNFRKALSAAYDRDALCSTIIKDGSGAAYFPVPEQLATGPDGNDFREDAGSYKEQIGTYDDAVNYLAAAKEELGQDTFEIELLVEDDTTAKNVAAYIQECWNKLDGVTVTLKTETKKQRVEDIQNGDYCTCLTRWGPDFADPMTYLNMWTTGCTNNYGLWSNPDYDALIADCTSGELATDPNARWQALIQADKMIMDEMVILPVYQKANATMIRDGVEGIEFHAVAINRVFKNATVG